MISLREALSKRSESIRRASCVVSITFHVNDSQSFTVNILWRGGALSKTYTYNEYYIRSGVMEPRLRKPVCQIQRELIQEILKKRGI
jgi:hypothetical protein